MFPSRAETVHEAFHSNTFQANVPLLEKPCGWFLIVKHVKNTCGRMIF